MNPDRRGLIGRAAAGVRLAVRRPRRCAWAIRAGLSLLVASSLALAGQARAFHERGVAHCNGCHTIHDSQDGMPVNPDGSAGEWLLIRETPTDVCLTCHADANGAVFASDPLNPPPEKGAGNFVFLLEDNLNDAPGGGQPPIPGYEAGHNVVSPGWGIPPDPANPTAPGGSFPSDQLGCTSCHDPHGNTSFRMLRGTGTVGGIQFMWPAPTGEGIDLDGAESPTNHTAYQDGWSQWCRNCHGLDPHGAHMSFDHPLSRAVGANEARNYNVYDGPANPVGGDFASAYLPQLPIESPAMTISTTAGISGNDRISCMTCHRAHATSAPKALRWDPNVLRLDDDGLVSGSYSLPDPYAHPEQRALCIKCHYPVASQHGMDEPCMSCHRNPDPTGGGGGGAREVPPARGLGRSGVYGGEGAGR